MPNFQIFSSKSITKYFIHYYSNATTIFFTWVLCFFPIWGFKICKKFKSLIKKINVVDDGILNAIY